MLRTTSHRVIAGRKIVLIALLSPPTLCMPESALAGTNGVMALEKFSAVPYYNMAPVADRAGNLYATSSSGGTSGEGFVYELVAPSSPQAKWSFRNIIDFDGQTVSLPFGRLATDGAGNLYGVSYYGGKYSWGALYELLKPVPPAKRWQLKLVHSFNNGSDPDAGVTPYAGVTFGPDGTIYGTTLGGGAIGVGTVYTLSPPDQAGKRSYRTIHQFRGLDTIGGRNDGLYPESNLVLDGNGNLIGTTYDGNYSGLNEQLGTIYELSPPVGGAGDWSFRILHRFRGRNDGAFPSGELMEDGAGDIFGTTPVGGTTNNGTAFELTPRNDGSPDWTFQTIASFGTSAGDVYAPMDGVSIDQQGRLFGAANGGGGKYTPGCGGGVFRLTPPSQGVTTWTKEVLALLGEKSTVRLGCNPAGSLTPLVGGKFFGVTGVPVFGLNVSPVLYSVSP